MPEASEKIAGWDRIGNRARNGRIVEKLAPYKKRAVRLSVYPFIRLSVSCFTSVEYPVENGIATEQSEKFYRIAAAEGYIRLSARVSKLRSAIQIKAEFISPPPGEGRIFPRPVRKIKRRRSRRRRRRRVRSENPKLGPTGPAGRVEDGQEFRSIGVFASYFNSIVESRPGMLAYGYGA